MLNTDDPIVLKSIDYREIDLGNRRRCGLKENIAVNFSLSAGGSRVFKQETSAQVYSKHINTTSLSAAYFSECKEAENRKDFRKLVYGRAVKTL